MLRRLIGTVCLVTALLVPHVVLALDSDKPRPDIIVVMVDDLGAIDERLLRRLPNIKSLWLDGGLRFDAAYTETPLCCPSRATFLSGKHTRNHGVVKNRARLFNPTVSIATALHDVGYWTVMAGKYFNHSGELTDHTPPGWDRVAMLAETKADATARFWVQDVITTTGYGDRFIADTAQRWATEAPANKPLFMFLTPKAPHWGPTTLQPWVPYIEPKYTRARRCRGISPWKPPGYSYAPKPNGFPLVKLCRSLLTVDDMVGRLRTNLESQGRDPYWVFMSDNGMAWGRNGYAHKNVPQATRFPMYISGPGIARGATSALISSIDVGPTIAALAGTNLPGSDGFAFLPVLRGATFSRTWMLEDHPLGGYTGGPGGNSGPWWGIRTPDWHFVRWRYDRLYDLRKDPWELVNVAAKFPAEVTRLVALRGTVHPIPGWPTPTPSPSPTASPTLVATPRASPTASPTASPSAGSTPSQSPSPTASPTKSPSPSPTPTPSASPTAAPTPTPSASPSPNVTASPSPSVTASPSPSPSPSPTAEPAP